MEVARFVCLANSRKLGGRCVAGLRIRDRKIEKHDWVRPVSTSERGEVPIPQYASGGAMRLGDIVRFREGSSVPHGPGYQPENVEFAGPWENEGRVTWNELCSHAERPTEPWPVGTSSSMGSNDRFLLQQAVQVDRSLTLQRVKNLRLSTLKSSFNGAIEVRGEFMVGTTLLRLRVTDPVVEQQLQASQQAQVLPDTLVCLSLGEPLQGYVYKLIAGIIQESDL